MTSTDLSSSEPSPPRRCLATTARGTPCRAWAVKGTDHCVAHTPRPGPPLADRDPPCPKLDTIDDLIADMLQKMALISALLDQAPDRDDLLKRFPVYSRGITHVARLLREKRLLPGQPADDLMTALGQALDELEEELDLKL
jgi:hypothetical protein